MSREAEMSSLVDLFWQSAKTSVSTEKIVQHFPKRRYRRDDLQRLANRWYGVRKIVHIELRMVAEGGVILEAIPPKQVFSMDAPIPASVTFKTRRYEFPRIAMAKRFADYEFAHWVNYDGWIEAEINNFRRLAEPKIVEGTKVIQ